MGCFSGIGYGVGGFYLISFCLFLTTSVLDSIFSFQILGSLLNAGKCPIPNFITILRDRRDSLRARYYSCICTCNFSFDIIHCLYGVRCRFFGVRA